VKRFDAIQLALVRNALARELQLYGRNIDDRYVGSHFHTVDRESTWTRADIEDPHRGADVLGEHLPVHGVLDPSLQRGLQPRPLMFSEIVEVLGNASRIV
jgi:hypothetical protein